MMAGSLTDQLITGFRNNPTNRARVATNECSTLMLHFWLLSPCLRQDLVKNNQSAAHDYFLVGFVSCIDTRALGDQLHGFVHK